jgi:prepilin-type N-terminal cleavage/methylation domain-containing protein
MPAGSFHRIFESPGIPPTHPVHRIMKTPPWKNGFTLVEVLVVITILVVLAGITFSITGNDEVLGMNVIHLDGHGAWVPMEKMKVRYTSGSLGLLW